MAPSLDGAAWAGPPACVLLVGGDGLLAHALADALGSGARVLEAATEGDAIELVIRETPDAVLAPGALVAPLGALLDPLGRGSGPAVIDSDGLEPALLARQVAAAAEVAALRARVRSLESLLGDGALAVAEARTEADAAALGRLARAAEYRDDNTWEHTERVGETAARIALRLGLDDEETGRLRLAAPLHDLGKIAVPDEVLLKPGRLTPEEYEVVKTHAIIGATILEEGSSPLLRCAERVARTHHERWDGGGYPDGLAGDAIPMEGRIVAVADVFDVLVHERPYRSRATPEDALAELRRNSGTQFDPAVVDAFAGLGTLAVQALATGTI